ncbi:carbohydrate ABC transporter permease [Kribbella sp. NPDC056951]|uniref:carbohydrate ABC transporter permease n=1 Tax=Kribbella sp. NPDC056951 TaxID=3345978 RepID=UPI003635C6CC
MKADHRHGRSGYLFVTPFMLVFAAMFVAPLAYAAYLSLFRTQLIGGTVFVGLGNYVDALKDQHLSAGLFRIIKFFFLQVPLMIVLATVFALIIDSGRVWAPKLYRLAFFVPYAVPAVVASLMWGYLYGPKFGALTNLAADVGLPNPAFLSPEHLLASVSNIVTWEFTGYNMIILYAALRSIPTELYEAAQIDGAGPVRIALTIKLPLLKPALAVILLFSIIGSFQLFNEPRVLSPTAGAAITPDWTPNLYAYTLAFTDQQINYSAAVSFLLGFVILVATYVVFGLGRLRRKP